MTRVHECIQNCRETLRMYLIPLTLITPILTGALWLIGSRPEDPTPWEFLEETSRTWAIAMVVMILWRLVLQAASKWQNSSRTKP